MRLGVIFCFLSLTIYLTNSEKYYKEPKQFSLLKDYESFLDEHRDYKENDLRYKNVTFLKLSQANFLRMKKEIEAHHSAYRLNLTTFDRKLQRWSDLSKVEKMRILCGTKLPRRARAATTNAAYLRILKALPKVPNGTQVNNCHFPNPIPDQQTCGCCWAWSCVQVVEHQLMMLKKQRVQLSVQQLLDCDTSNDACDGGWPTNGFRHMEIFGMTNAAEYSYQQMHQPVCKRAFYRKLLSPNYIAQQMEIEFKGDEESMKKLIMRIGVAVVAMHADEEFLSITKGFYINDSCPKNDPNHAMVICGFGTDENGEYWLIRNSWGSSWGEYGYVKIKMGNTCGVASFAMWPIIIGERSLNPLTGEVEDKFFEKNDEEYLRQ
ncbi:hypothetical protein PVAND_006860 [Polypedilum vanderplanki]|uniref:Peptidase C1A papain C-terminal domain-containing protein n=1 Tax=Polypedilum vanderplanki TaxID=319348 RepID=A0A9J6C4H3_POLVA|nr:hypothetical protein PVAND_006860 [Polypedilum vanderplanki]